MSRSLLAAAIVGTTALVGTHHAVARVHGCSVDSHYNLNLSKDALEFRQDADYGSANVRIAGDRLFVNGAEVSLAADDRRRVADIDHGVRALVPQVRAIAIDAMAIAFEAVTRVAETFADDPSEVTKLRGRLSDTRLAFEQKLDAELAHRPFDDKVLEDSVERAVKDIVPIVVGDIVGKALKVALSGDEAAAKRLEERADKLDRTIQKEVEGRAKELEQRAEAFCSDLRHLDSLENDLAYRQADGKPLNLIEAR
jgi:hypothetical protein